MNSVNKKKLIGQLSIYRSVLTLLVICVFVATLPPSFLSVTNPFNAFRQIAAASTVGCGMTSVVLTGGIDLSVDSILGLAGVLAPGILESTGSAGAAILVVLAVGTGCGVANGFPVAVCEIPPFIFTLGMMTSPRECILVHTEGPPIPVKADAHKFFGKGTVAGVPVPVIILIILFLIAHYVLTQTSYGRSIYTFGGSREVAYLSGISTRFTEWTAYTLNGLTCGVAGVIPIARLGLAQSTSGTDIEMDAITAVILDGTSLGGGMGFVLPTVVDAMIMGTIDNILTLMDVNPHATNIVEGAVILIAALVDKKMKDLLAKAE